MPAITDHIRESGSQPARAAAAFQHAHTRTDPHGDEDLANFFRIHDLGGALDVLDEVSNPRL